MRTTRRDPTIIEDIGALADLYVGVFRMMGRRIQARTHIHKQAFPALPDELLPPPLPDRRTQRHPTLISRRN